MKKELSIILILVLAFSALFAVPAMAEGSIRLLTEDAGGKDEAEMQLFSDALGQALGMTVTIEKPPADYANVLMQKLQGGEAYDLIYFTQQVYLNLIDQGVLTDLTDKLETSEVFKNNVDPSEWEAIKVDGKVYAGFNKKEIHKPVLLNKVHLLKAGIDYKSIQPTLDGYYDVFKKLKQTITTENYYPYNVVLKTVNNIQPWMASVGLKAGVVRGSDGKTYVPFATDDAAPVWEWLKKLYQEDLMDPSCLVDGTGDMRAKVNAASQTTSIVVDWAAFVGLHISAAAAENIPLNEYEIVSLPGTTTPDGGYMLTKGAASLWGIPVNAPNPEGALKALEYFATQEGGELLSIGVKDYDYTVTDGKYA
jgi:putative aldouronate transport system substrate-binding protein